MTTIESEVRALLKAIAADPRDTYVPAAAGECDNKVCLILGRLESRVVGRRGAQASSNGKT